MTSTADLSIGGGDAIGADHPHNQAFADPKRSRRKDAAPEDAAQAAPSGGHRLAIQQDPLTGEWIYTVTDRDNGQIVARLTREDVARLGLKSDYAAGALVKAKA
jgi:hydrogenase maturation factor